MRIFVVMTWKPQEDNVKTEQTRTCQENWLYVFLGNDGFVRLSVSIFNPVLLIGYDLWIGDGVLEVFEATDFFAYNRSEFPIFMELNISKYIKLHF